MFHSTNHTFTVSPESTVLILGLGGGTDIISSIALGKMLNLTGPNVYFGNTKSGRTPTKRLTPIINTQFAYQIPEPLPRPNGKRWRSPILEECIPRVNENPYLLFKCLKDESVFRQLGLDIQQTLSSFNITHILAVDTGGDVLSESSTSGPMGRDRRMLEGLKQLDVSITLFVVGPGSDGESTEVELQRAFAAHEEQYLATISSAGMRPTLEELGEWVGKDRTVNIIARAHSTTMDTQRIKRNKKSLIPTSMLRDIWVFQISSK
jgi:hypothetical protein